MIEFEKQISKQEACENLSAAMKSGDEKQMAGAWKDFSDAICQTMRKDFDDFKQSGNDSAILAQRGYRQLTSDEKSFYQRLTSALKSGNPKQVFTEVIGEDIESDFMPETIIEDVYRELRERHELLDVINFIDAGYSTKWLLSDSTITRAVWGQITDAITKEIQGGFRIIDVKQNKLSAYAFIERGMLDMGPTFLDAYIRACLVEARSLGIIYGIVKGTGVNEPIGLIKDVSADSNFNQSTGWDTKEQIPVTELSAASYGALLAQLATSENGKSRDFGEVCLLVNQKTYLSKVVPATKVMAADGRYVSMLDSIYPTRVITESILEDDEAILFIPELYYYLEGRAARSDVVEFSDDFKFLDDLRYFKIVSYGNGRCYDNTCALYLDLENLAPAALPVKVTSEVVMA